MKFEEFNAAIRALGYAPVTSQAFDTLSQEIGESLGDWARSCLESGSTSAYWESLRNVLMALSVPVSEILTKLELEPTAKERVHTFLAGGKTLRSVFAFLHKGQGGRASMDQAKATCVKAFPEAQQRKMAAIKSKVHHVYATTSAVAFEHSKTGEGRACLQVEAASRPDRSVSFDWRNKISLQLKDQEIVQFLAVLRNWMDSVEIANHGANRDKRLTLKKQERGAGFVISVRQGTTAKVVPIPPFEAFAVFSICLKVVCENMPHMSAELVLEMCREMAGATASASTS